MFYPPWFMLHSPIVLRSVCRWIFENGIFIYFTLTLTWFQAVNSVCWMTIYKKLLQTTEFLAHLNLNLHWKMESGFYGQWTYFSFLLFLSASWLKKALPDLIYNRHYGMSVWEMSSFYCVLYQILTISCEAIYSSHSTHY